MNYKKTAVAVFIAAAIIAAFQLIYLWPEKPSPQPPEQLMAGEETQKFDKNALYLLINAHRKEAGLSSLRIDPALEISAGAKISDMLNKNYFRHQDTENQESWYLFTNAGYNFKKAGENIAFQHNSPWQVFDGWVNSPSHNQQLLEPQFEDMGAAIDCLSITETPGENCIVVLHLGLK